MSARPSSPKEHHPPPISLSSPRPSRFKLGGRRIKARTWLLAALAVVVVLWQARERGYSLSLFSDGSGDADTGSIEGSAPRRKVPSRVKPRATLEEPEPVPESDWLSFLKTGKVPEESRDDLLAPPAEAPWRIVGVDAIRRVRDGDGQGIRVGGRRWWNPLTWFSGSGRVSNMDDEMDDFSLIDQSWTSSHLHPFPDSDSLSDVDIDRDLADISPADDDPELSDPTWLDWRKLDEAEAEEEAQAGIVGALRPKMSDPLTREVVRETAKWRKLKASDEQRLGALSGLVPPDPEKALSEIGKGDVRELGRRMREFFALRRRHAEVWVHFRERHGIKDPWAWRPNHPSSPMPPFPKAEGLTGPLSDEPSNPTSPNNPLAKRPYVHPELTPRMLDYAKWFLRTYENLLFPYLRPAFSSLSALHRNSKAGGRGIIMSAGDPQLRACMVAIRTIREKMGSRLPIEIWYSGSGDLSDWGASRLKRWGGVTVRDIRMLFDHNVADLGGWAIKPFAVLGSSFREVIFVDADVIFMQPPDNLFHHPLYLDTGALFFRDRHNLFPDSRGHGDWLRSVMPNPPSDTLRAHRMFQGKGQHDMESGVMVIDRWKHMEGLLGAAKLMSKDWREAAGKWALGDKELFWFGFELVSDTSYAMHPARSGVLGVLIPKHLPGGSTVHKMGKNASFNPTDGWYPTPQDRGKICGIQLAHPSDPGYFEGGPRYGNEPESDEEDGEPGFNITRPNSLSVKDELEGLVQTFRSRRRARLEALKSPANQTVDPAFRLSRIPPTQPWILWFNGGLQTDKFHGDLFPHGDAALARMEHWIDEPEEGDWEISDSNVFCVHIGKGKRWRRPKMMRRSERDLIKWVENVYIQLEAGADQPEDW